MKYQALKPMTDTAIKAGRVAVLMGGTAAEREVSLKSGGFVLDALQQAGVDAFGVDVGADLCGQLAALEADRVFNILHGRVGEDGQIQAVLETLGLPYVGSGIKASALTMDKLMTKRLLQGCGLATPPFTEIESRADCPRVIDEIGLPMIIKPLLEGSSIGMSKVTSAEQLPEAYELAAQYGAVMAEKWIDGEEYTIAWMGGQVLPAIRLETPHTFYDYDAKYIASDTQYHCPCGLEGEALAQLEALVARSVEVCDLRHWGRVDVMRDSDGNFLVIEINTVPGMTDHSLVPMAAREAGLDFQQLVVKLLEYSIQAGVGRD